MTQKLGWFDFPVELEQKVTAKYYSDEELFHSFIQPVYKKGRDLALEELFSRESPTARRYQRNILRYHLFNKTIPTLRVDSVLLKQTQYGFGVDEELFALLNIAYLVRTDFEDKSLCSLLKKIITDVSILKHLKYLDILLWSYLEPNFNMNRGGFDRTTIGELKADPDLAIYIFRGISCRRVFLGELLKPWGAGVALDKVTIDLFHNLVAEFPEVVEENTEQLVNDFFTSMNIYQNFFDGNGGIIDEAEKNTWISRIKLLMPLIVRDNEHVKKVLKFIKSFLTSCVHPLQHKDSVLEFCSHVKEICSYIDADSKEVVKTFVGELLAEESSFWRNYLLACFLSYMQKNDKDLFKEMLNVLLERLFDTEKHEDLMLKNRVLEEVSLTWSEDLKQVIRESKDSREFLLLMSMVKQFSAGDRKEILGLVLDSISEGSLNEIADPEEMCLYVQLVERFIRHEDVLDEENSKKVGFLLSKVVYLKGLDVFEKVKAIKVLSPFCTVKTTQSLTKVLLKRVLDTNPLLSPMDVRLLKSVSDLVRVFCPDAYKFLQEKVKEFAEHDRHQSHITCLGFLSYYSKDLGEIDANFLRETLGFYSEYFSVMNMNVEKSLLKENIDLFLDLVFYYLKEDEEVIDKELVTNILTALSSIYKDEVFGYHIREVRPQLIKALTKVLTKDEVLEALSKMLLRKVTLIGLPILFEYWLECGGDVEKENAMLGSFGIQVDLNEKKEPEGP